MGFRGIGIGIGIAPSGIGIAIIGFSTNIFFTVKGLMASAWGVL